MTLSVAWYNSSKKMTPLPINNPIHSSSSSTPPQRIDADPRICAIIASYLPFEARTGYLLETPGCCDVPPGEKKRENLQEKLKVAENIFLEEDRLLVKELQQLFKYRPEIQITKSVELIIEAPSDDLIGVSPKCSDIKGVTVRPNVGNVCISRLLIPITSKQSLRSLNLSGCTQLTDLDLKAISEKCPNLQSLNLSGCTEITDIGLEAMMKKCPKLQSVNLAGCNKIILDISQSFSSEWPSVLNDLVAAYLPPEERGGYLLKTKPKRLTPSQEVSYLSKCLSRVRRTLLQDPIIQLSTLQNSFDDPKWKIEPNDLGLICDNSSAPTPEELSLIFQRGLGPKIIRIEVLKPRKPNPKIFYRSLSEKALISLAENCPRLENLTIEGIYQITNASLFTLAKNCSHLQSLSLVENSEILDAAEFPDITLGILAIAENCKDLERFTHQLSATDESVMAIAGCPKLRELDVRRCSISGETIITVAQKCPLLETLMASGSTITDESMFAISKGCPRLRKLHLDSVNVSELGIRALAQGCRDLNTVRISFRTICMPVKEIVEGFPKLRELALSGLFCQSNIDALAEGPTDLEVLELNIAEITNAHAKMITRRYPRLRTLILKGTKITPEGVADIVSNCPNLESFCLANCLPFSPLITQPTVSIFPDAAVKAIVEKCPRLRTLDLGYFSITETCEKMIACLRPLLEIKSVIARSTDRVS